VDEIQQKPAALFTLFGFAARAAALLYGTPSKSLEQEIWRSQLLVTKGFF
jgi:hypothetical protein